jgi:hypothetical protein
MLVQNSLKNWSYKKLKMYRSCPFSVYLKYVKRVPEPPIDPKFDAKRLRGITAHDDLAECVNHGAAVPQEFNAFEDIIEGYRELNAVAEEDEYFDSNWNLIKKPPGEKYWNGYWLVVKKDVRLATGEFVLVVDWKTGKKFGNEVDHFEQMKLYAVTEWRKDPGFAEYSVELQYLDKQDTWQHTFKPRDLERHWAVFDKDVSVMMSDRFFRPKPNKLTCQYCPFNHKNGTGACPVAAV